MARCALMLNRPQMLRALPKHVFFALVSGAVAGPILYYLSQIEIEASWNIMLVPMGAVLVNAAMLPVAIPGKNWSFAFIGAMLLFLLLLAGLIISPKFPFPHARNVFGLTLPRVNTFSYLLVLCGGCLGLFYGMIAGKRSSMVVGSVMGAACGFLIGIALLNLFTGINVNITDIRVFEVAKYVGGIHAMWQVGGAMALLHLGACLGAAMGAGPAPANPQSEIRNPKSK